MFYRCSCCSFSWGSRVKWRICLLSYRRYSHRSQEKAHTYSWAQKPGVDHSYSVPGGPLYGRLCYSSHTLPVRRNPGDTFEPGLAELGYRFPGGQPDHSLVIQNQGATVGPMESGAVYVGPTDLTSGSRTGSRTGSRDETAPQSGVSTSDGGTPRTSDSQERGGGTGTASNCTDGSSEDKGNPNQDVDWVRNRVAQNPVDGWMDCNVMDSHNNKWFR